MGSGVRSVFGRFGHAAWRIVLVAGLLLAVLPPADRAAAQEPHLGAVFSWEVVPCPSVPASPNEVEGRTYDCGIVVVPENHNQPTGRTLELVYMRLRSSSPSPAPDPVVFLSGGPGGSALLNMTIPELHVTLGRMRQSRDVIAYDQRGTGFSGLLVCGPYQAAIGVVEEERPETVAEIEQIMQGPRGQALQYGACARGYTSKGLDLAQYNSISSARDIAALTRVLGYDTYNLYGGSYGTRLGQTAMRSTPERVRSAILDGVTSTSTPAAARTVAKLYEQYVNIFGYCAADPACNAAYPNLEQRFIALLKTLQAKPLVLDPPIVSRKSLPSLFPASIESITPDFFGNLADLANARNYRMYGRLAPRLIAEFERGDTAFLRTVFADTGSPEVAAPTPVGELGRDLIRPDRAYFAASLDVLLERGEAASSAPKNGPEAWVARVVADLRQRLLAGEPQADVIKSLIRLTLLHTESLRPEVLTSFADRTLSPSAAAEANSIVSQMSRHDLRLTMWAIQDIAAQMGGSNERDSSTGALLAVNCSEEFPFVTVDDMQRYLDNAPYPGLVGMPISEIEGFFMQACKFYPPTVLDRSYIEPVVSDIPALLYLEGLDIQTPRAWGRLTAQGLRNSFVVEWETEGHVVGHRSPDGCAGDIAVAFLNDPRRQPNIACSRAERYRLRFVLPDEVWSPQAGQ